MKSINQWAPGLLPGLEKLFKSASRCITGEEKKKKKKNKKNRFEEKFLLLMLRLLNIFLVSIFDPTGDTS